MGLCASRSAPAGQWRMRPKLPSFISRRSLRKPSVSRKSFSKRFNSVTPGEGDEPMPAGGSSGDVDDETARRVLLEVLRDRQLTRALIEFCAVAWPKKLGRQAALSHLHLFLDIEDFRKFRESAFRDVLARRIFAHYLDHGTEETVFVSSVAVRIAQEIIESMDDRDGRVPSSVFDELQQDCFGYLLAEVIPCFFFGSEPFGYHSVLERLNAADDPESEMNELLSKGEDGSARSEGSNAADPRAAMVERLDELLRDATRMRQLRSLCAQESKEALLTFFLEVSDFDAVSRELTASSSLNPSDSDYLYMRAARMYSTFVRPDAPQFVELGQEAVRLTRRALNLLPRQPLSGVFKHPQGVAAALLFKYFVPRLTSAPDPDQQSESSQRLIKLPLPEDLRDSRAPSVDKLMQPPHSATFMRFMEAVGREGVLLFALEAENYAAIPTAQSDFRKAVARKMYDKFVGRSVQTSARLNDSMCSAIVERLAIAPPDLFADALAVVRTEMTRLDIPAFMRHPLFRELKGSSSSASKRGSAGSSPTSRSMNVAGLESTLMDQHTCAFFRRYAELEFCDSLVQFWLEVEDVKRLPQSDYQALRCRKIARRFIVSGAPAPVPVSDDARTEALLHDGSPQAFRAAQLEVLQTLAIQVYPRFLDTQLYRDMQKAGPRRRASLLGGVSATPQAAAGASGPAGGVAEEQTLVELLQDPRGCAYFVEFCKQNMCEENILFWIDVQELQVIPSDGYMRMRAYKMSRKYFGTRATMQLNVSSHIAAEIQANLHTPSRSIFNKAQAEILFLMQKDSYPRFLKSPQNAEYRTGTGPVSDGPQRRLLPPITRFRKNSLSSTVTPADLAAALASTRKG